MAPILAAPSHVADHLCRALQVQGQLWDSAILKQWSSATTTPYLRAARMGLAGPLDMGTEFVRQVVSKS